MTLAASVIFGERNMAGWKMRIFKKEIHLQNGPSSIIFLFAILVY